MSRKIIDRIFIALPIEPFYMREPNPTKPANYRGSYAAACKKMLDIEITIHRNVRIVIERTITIHPETTVKSMMEILLKLMVCEQGGLRN
jgi:hypothetical protein